MQRRRGEEGDAHEVHTEYIRSTCMPREVDAGTTTAHSQPSVLAPHSSRPAPPSPADASPPIIAPPHARARPRTHGLSRGGGRDHTPALCTLCPLQCSIRAFVTAVRAEARGGGGAVHIAPRRTSCCPARSAATSGREHAGKCRRVEHALPCTLCTGGHQPCDECSVACVLGWAALRVAAAAAPWTRLDRRACTGSGVRAGTSAQSARGAHWDGGGAVASRAGGRA